MYKICKKYIYIKGSIVKVRKLFIIITSKHFQAVFILYLVAIVDFDCYVMLCDT